MILGGFNFVERLFYLHWNGNGGGRERSASGVGSDMFVGSPYLCPATADPLKSALHVNNGDAPTIFLYLLTLCIIICIQNCVGVMRRWVVGTR